MILIVLQYFCDTDTMIKAFLSAIKLPGKSKFKHFLYDLSLRNAVIVTLYTLYLFTSLLFPITNILAVLFFTCAVSNAL